MQPQALSKADSMVLAQVFDPESAPTKTEVIVDPYLPEDRNITDAATLTTLKAREKQAIVLVEEHEKAKAGPQYREQAYQKALALLNDLIEDYPEYASARNNRAQLRRWHYGDRNTLCQHRSNVNQTRVRAGSEAVQDLQESINLASPLRPQDPVSPAQGRLLGQAHTQLAALYYAASKDLSPASNVQTVASIVDGWSKDVFEEEGSRNFYLGGLFGNEVAKALAVHTNPQAKLCGSIVKEAMRNELAGL